MSKRFSIKEKKLSKKYQYILKKLSQSSVKNRKLILENAPSELFRALTLIIRIISENDVTLPKKRREKLNKHKAFLQRTKTLKQSAINKELKNQRGGFLPAILTAVLPIVANILKSVI